MAENNPLLVTVRWADAHSSAVEDISLVTLPDVHTPLIMETTGWLLLDDDKGVSLAYEKDVSSPGSYRGYTFIPRAMVITVTPVIKTRKRAVKRAAPPLSPDGSTEPSP